MASIKEELIREDPLAPKADEVVDEETQDEDIDELEDEKEVEDDETDEDEDEDDESEDEDEEDSDEDDEESEDEDEEDEDDEPAFKKRFTQIKGDTQDEYLENLETAYHESSSEAIRLNKEYKETKANLETLLGAVTGDKELTELLEQKLGEQKMKTATTDPAMEYAKNNVEAQWKQEWQEFANANPDVVSDTALREKVVTTLVAVEKGVKETEGRTLGMKEGLEIVSGILKLNQPTKEEKIRVAAKKQVSGKSSTGSKKKAKKKAPVSDKAMALAGRFGYTEEQVRKFNQ